MSLLTKVALLVVIVASFCAAACDNQTAELRAEVAVLREEDWELLRGIMEQQEARNAGLEARLDALAQKLDEVNAR